MCHTNNCPAGIATQKPELRAKLNVSAGIVGTEMLLRKVSRALQEIDMTRR